MCTLNLSVNLQQTLAPFKSRTKPLHSPAQAPYSPRCWRPTSPFISFIVGHRSPREGANLTSLTHKGGALH